MPPDHPRKLDASTGIAGVNDGDWCWCHARFGLAVPATRKSHGIGERAPDRNDICGPCSSRGAAACEKAHIRERDHAASAALARGTEPA